MQTASDPPKSPEKNTHWLTAFASVVSILVGYFFSQPFDKAKRSDSDLVNKVDAHETRIQNLERFQGVSDERFNYMNKSLDKIERTQVEMLEELRKRK